jgi:hypothetical protein
MQALSRPISPVNTPRAATSKALVKPAYPGKKLTETTIATCAPAPRPEFVECTECTVLPSGPYAVMPCVPCYSHAVAERKRFQEKFPVPVDGTHTPYVMPSVNSNKKNKQAGAPVLRSVPNPSIHALPGPRVAYRVHNPYVTACDNGVCTGQCVNGLCKAGVPWNGECTQQDICKMLGADQCICYLTEEVPKCMVACLDWVNCGKCDPSLRGLTACPYAHPDLTQVHPDVCCNFLLTGICRFHQTGEKAVVATEVQKKKKNGKNRGPSDCTGCHCAAPEGGAFPLLPGLTKKILRPLRTEGTGQEKRTVEWDCTDLNRALAFYQAYLNRY